MSRTWASILAVVMLASAGLSFFAAGEYSSRESAAYRSRAGSPPSAPGSYRPFNASSFDQQRWNSYDSSRSRWESQRRLDDREQTAGRGRLDDFRLIIQIGSVASFLFAMISFGVAGKKLHGGVRWVCFFLAFLCLPMIGWSLILSGGIGFDEVWGAWIGVFVLFFIAAAALPSLGKTRAAEVAEQPTPTPA